LSTNLLAQPGLYRKQAQFTHLKENQSTQTFKFRTAWRMSMTENYKYPFAPHPHLYMGGYSFQKSYITNLICQKSGNAPACAS